MRNINLTR